MTSICGTPYADEFELGQTSAVLSTHMRDFLNKGYELYSGNYYNLVKFFDVMRKKHTHLWHTTERSETFTEETYFEELKKGQCIAMQSDNISECKWKDKSDVFMSNTL